MNSLKFQDRLLGLQDNLLNFAYMLTANREEAKDLLQDTTLKALDNEDKYIDNVNFKGWVFTIMRNIFINNYRRVVRNQTIIDQTEDLYHLNLPQDTTLKALDNEDKYIDNVNFKGWVFTIMRNIFINNYRRVVRNQTIIDQTEDLYHLNLPQDSGFASPEGSFTVKEITTAINSFSEEYRIPFSMHVAGYKYHEIAEKMDLPLGTVKSRIFFARQRLQEMLKDYK